MGGTGFRTGNMTVTYAYAAYVYVNVNVSYKNEKLKKRYPSQKLHARIYGNHAPTQTGQENTEMDSASS
jgi:hypothetical protein